MGNPLLLGIKFVAKPKNSFDKNRMPGIRLQLLPQTPDRIIYGSHTVLIFLTPDCRIKLLPCVNPTRGFRHAVKNGVFAVIYANFPSGLQYSPRSRVDFNISKRQHGGCGFNNLNRLIPQSIHDSLKNGFIRVDCPYNDNLLRVVITSSFQGIFVCSLDSSNAADTALSCWKLLSLIACSIRQASHSASFGSTPALTSRRVKKQCFS